MIKTEHHGVITAVPKGYEIRREIPIEEGKTRFTDDEIHDIIELGESIRRIRVRLISEGKMQAKKEKQHESK
jgi:hypothetical protein